MSTRRRHPVSSPGRELRWREAEPRPPRGRSTMRLASPTPQLETAGDRADVVVAFVAPADATDARELAEALDAQLRDGFPGRAGAVLALTPRRGRIHVAVPRRRPAPEFGQLDPAVAELRP